MFIFPLASSPLLKMMFGYEEDKLNFDYINKVMGNQILE